MNNYLLLLGSNFEQIRQILNFTQEEMADKLGVSRPTIVKLEQDPSRFTKTLALALFMVVTNEMTKRINNLKNIDLKKYSDPKNSQKFFNIAKEASALTTAALTTAAIKGLGGLIGGIVSYAWIKSKVSKPNENTVLEENWNIENGQRLINELVNLLKVEKSKLLNCFNLESFSIEEFMDLLENKDNDKKLD